MPHWTEFMFENLHFGKKMTLVSSAESSSMDGKLPPRTLLLLVFLAAALVRTWYFLEFRISPYYDHLMVDAQGYHLQALEILKGNWVGDEIFFQDPLYPYFLAVIYQFFGQSYIGVYCLQSVLGIGSCLLTTLLARNVFGHTPYGNVIALVSGLGCALSMPLVFYDFLLLKTSLTLFLTLANLYVLIIVSDRVREFCQFEHNASLQRLVLATLSGGILLGLNFLNRGNYILLSPIFFIWLLWIIWQLSKTLPSARRSKLVALIATVYVVGISLVVFPVTLRNYVVGNEWVLATSQGGVNLYLGNNPNADGALARPASVVTNPLTERYDYLAIAEKAEGRSLSWSEMNQYYIRQVKKWVLECPGDALLLYLKKWNLWLAGNELADNYSYNFLRDHYTASLKLPIASGYVVSLLGWSALILSVCYLFKPKSLISLANPKLQLIVLFVLTYSGSITLFYIKSRLRIPIYPELIIMASAGSVWLFTEAKYYKQQMFGFVIGLMLLAAVVTRPLWQTHWPYNENNINGTQYYNLGVKYLQASEIDKALAAFDQAEPLITDNFTALNNMASFYLRAGRRARAYQLYVAKTQQLPHYYSGLYNLAFLAFQDSRYGLATTALKRLIETYDVSNVDGLPPAAPRPYFMLGEIARQQGNSSEANQYFRLYLNDETSQTIFANSSYRYIYASLVVSTNELDKQAAAKLLAKVPANNSAAMTWKKNLVETPASIE